MSPLTAAELGAFLGITPGAIRQIIRRHGIRPTGKNGHAYLYNPRDIFKAAGTYDRRDAYSRENV